MPKINKKKYLEEIFKICKKELKINPRLPKQSRKRIKYFENIGLGLHSKWDSLNHVKILHCIEEKYHFEITEDNVLNFNNIRVAAKFLVKNHSKKISDKS